MSDPTEDGGVTSRGGKVMAETPSGERRWTVWVCVEPGCNYCRHAKSSGVHQTTNPQNPVGPMVRHELEPVEVIPVSEAERLREALERAMNYAHHISGCDYRGGEGVCDCGLRDLERSLSPDREASGG